MSAEITFEQRVASIERQSPSTFHVHEVVMASQLGYEGGNKVDQLNDFVNRVTRGGTGGNKKSANWRSNEIRGESYGAVKIKDIESNNSMNWHVERRRTDNPGVYSPDANPDNVKYTACFYTHGLHTEGNKVISLKKQLEICREVTGIETSLNTYIKERRAEQWRWALEGDTRGKEFIATDLPTLATKFEEELGVELFYVGNSITLSPTTIKHLRRVLSTILVCSHVLESMSVEDDEDEVMEEVSEGANKRARISVTPQPRHSSGGDTITPHDAPRRDSDGDMAEEAEEDVDAVAVVGGQEEIAIASPIANWFDYGVLHQLWFVDNNTKEVGRRELLLDGARNNLSLTMVNSLIRKLGGDVCSVPIYDAVCARKDLTRLSYNFDTIKGDIIKNTPRWHPFKLDKNEMLLQWIDDGYHYSNKKLLHRIYETGDNGSETMTIAAAVIIRHIIFAYNISLTSFPAMLACFAVLLVGRPYSKKEFFSKRTIRNHIMKLCIVDEHLIAKQYEETFVCDQPYGFQSYFYTSTDDTKHGKHDNRHVVIRSGNTGFDLDKNNDGFNIGDPFFDCISTRQSVSKDNKGNAEHNIEVLWEHCQSADVFACYNGNCTDNAAKSEGTRSAKLWKELLANKGHDELTMVYGVDREFINLADPFHCCNLAIQHCSEHGFGKTENGNNRESHHRQCMQSIHDIVICDKAMAQLICDTIIERYAGENDDGEKPKYTMKTCRERIQRWLVNGRNAKHILTAFDMELPEAPSNFWVLWAQEYLPLVDGWKKTALEEIIVFFMMDEIVVGLQFEAELVDYFEVTYQWHAMPGELCNRPGFRALELHHLLFDFIMPFWEKAREDFASRFPKTSGRITKMEAKANDLEDDDDNKAILLAKAEMKRDQVIYGIHAGYDEICKLYQDLLKAPMIFTAIQDPEQGPSILRAILALVTEAELDIDRADTEYDKEGGYDITPDTDLDWGDFKYENDDSSRPKDEQIWYDWLSEDKDKLKHWYQQLGWCRSVVLDELKKLSKERPHEESSEPLEEDDETHADETMDTGEEPKQKHRDPASSKRLRDFYDEYPIIFTSLRAVFGLLPSASRIVESAHGMMRQDYDAQVPAAYSNGKMRYKMNQLYDMNEKRRKYVRGLSTSVGERKAAKHSDRKELIEMLGKQLMDLLEKYDADLLASLSDLAKKKIKIGNINKTNAKIEEDRLIAKKAVHAENVRVRRNEHRGEVDLEHFSNIAVTAKTDHDRTFELTNERGTTEILQGMLTKTYWNAVPAELYKTDLFRTIPTFESEEAWLMTKTAIKNMTTEGDTCNLGEHLTTIKNISKKNAPNTLNDVDVSGMSEGEILREFVKLDQCISYANKQTKEDTKAKKLKAIFGIIGTDISNHQRFTSAQAYSIDDDSDEEDLEEEEVVEEEYNEEAWDRFINEE